MRVTRLCVAIGMTIACTSGVLQGQSRDVRHRIEAANEAGIAAFNKGDVGGFTKAYAPDAILMPPNAPAMKGAKDIQAYWEGGWKAGLRNVKLTTTEFSVSGSTAIETGTYALEVHPAPAAAPIHDHGKYIVIWKRGANGTWQMYRDIFNSDLPAAK